VPGNFGIDIFEKQGGLVYKLSFIAKMAESIILN
jgi:hypothetical protein